MHYYREKGTKNVWYQPNRLLVRPKEWEFLGDHPHPNPKMAVVSLTKYDGIGYSIKPVSDFVPASVGASAP